MARAQVRREVLLALKTPATGTFAQIQASPFLTPRERALRPLNPALRCVQDIYDEAQSKVNSDAVNICALPALETTAEAAQSFVGRYSKLAEARFMAASKTQPQP